MTLYGAHVFPLVLLMEDGVDNGMVIYILLTEQVIIAAELSIEKCNYISLHFNTPAKRCTEIFSNSLLGKKRFCYEKSLKILEGHFSSSVCNMQEIYAISRHWLIQLFSR